MNYYDDFIIVSNVPLCTLPREDQFIHLTEDGKLEILSGILSKLVYKKYGYISHTDGIFHIKSQNLYQFFNVLMKAIEEYKKDINYEIRYQEEQKINETIGLLSIEEKREILKMFNK